MVNVYAFIIIKLLRKRQKALKDTLFYHFTFTYFSIVSIGFSVIYNFMMFFQKGAYSNNELSLDNLKKNICKKYITVASSLKTTFKY